jgi:cell division septum initiation protein DivIVA
MEEPMDILHLIDRLEEILNESRPIPLTHTVLVDEDKVLDLIDQMRVAIPEEVKKAQQVLTQRDRILAQAQEEANRTLALARDRSEQMVERESIVQAAQARASDVGSQEIAKIQQIQQEADNYVLETLTRLEMELDRMITQVRNGISTLQAEKQPPTS